MRLGIMQPYFFPYLGYFALIKHTDRWVVFDSVQFIRHGWIERNRVLKPGDGWQYIKVPLIKHNRETLIKDVRIRNSESWCKKIIAQLGHYKKKAPYYNSVILLLEEMCSYEYDSIVELNTKILQIVCNKLGIVFDYQISSNLNLNMDVIVESDDWALEIAKMQGARIYINPFGGKEIFNKEKYSGNGIELKFMKLDLDKYDQKRENFEPGLSIIDVMMFNSSEEVNILLDQFILS